MKKTIYKQIYIYIFKYHWKWIKFFITSMDNQTRWVDYWIIHPGEKSNSEKGNNIVLEPVDLICCNILIFVTVPDWFYNLFGDHIQT